MNAKQRTTVIFILVMSLIISGCGSGQFPGIVATPSATSTLVPTSTPSPSSTPVPPTSTPSPTATETQIPASLGEVVSYNAIEISVLDMYRHDNLIPGNGYRYWANPGYMIIDLVVKVHNTGSTPASITWGDAYVIDDVGSRNEMIFAGLRPAAKKEKVDPLSIDYNDVSGSTEIQVTDTVYLRIIYIIPDKPEQKVLFGIGNSPLIEFTVKR